MSGDLTFQWEKWKDILPEAYPLLDFYFRNGGALFAKEMPMDPDFEGAAWLEVTGRLHILTARRGGALIGLNGFNVGGMLFRRAARIANGIILYLLPSERRGLAGVRLIKLAEEGLRKMGCEAIIYTNGSNYDLAPLLSRMGYTSSNPHGALFEKLLKAD